MVKCGLSMPKRSKKRIVKTNDYLTPLLIHAPAAWALIRANEIRALDKVTFKHPVLDVGCGDGLVAKVLMSNRKGKLDWGVDLSEREIKKAKELKIYKNCAVANVYNLPFKDRSFLTVFSNSVIEHIPDLERALSEMSRVLKKDGELIITVPSPYLAKYLMGTRIFGDWYGNLFNRLFRHFNLYNHNHWRKLLKKYSLRLTSHYYYHTLGMIQAHEILSYLSLPVYLLKPFLGRWIVFTPFRKVFVVPWLRGLLYKFYLEDVKEEKGGSLMIVAIKC